MILFGIEFLRIDDISHVMAKLTLIFKNNNLIKHVIRNHLQNIVLTFFLTFINPSLQQNGIDRLRPMPLDEIIFTYGAVSVKEIDTHTHKEAPGVEWIMRYREIVRTSDRPLIDMREEDEEACAR